MRYVPVRHSFCKEDNLSMNASWLIKPNDASNTMAAKIHEMKKGKGRILQGSCSYNTFSLLDLPRIRWHKCYHSLNSIQGYHYLGPLIMAKVKDKPYSHQY